MTIKGQEEESLPLQEGTVLYLVVVLLVCVVS